MEIIIVLLWELNELIHVKPLRTILGNSKCYKRVGASQVALVVKNPHAIAGDVRDMGLILGWGRFPWRRAWQPAPNTQHVHVKGLVSILAIFIELWRMIPLINVNSSLSLSSSLSPSLRFLHSPKHIRTPNAKSQCPEHRSWKWRHRPYEAPGIWSQDYHHQLCRQWFLFLFWNGKVSFLFLLPFMAFHT